MAPPPPAVDCRVSSGRRHSTRPMAAYHCPATGPEQSSVEYCTCLRLPLRSTISSTHTAPSGLTTVALLRVTLLPLLVGLVLLLVVMILLPRVSVPRVWPRQWPSRISMAGVPITLAAVAGGTAAGRAPNGGGGDEGGGDGGGEGR